MAVFGHAVLPVIAWLQFRLGWLALASMVFFAYLPDADIFFHFFFSGDPMLLHRGFTHSLAFALIPLAIYFFIRKAELLWGFGAALTHVAVDGLDTMGTPALWPFTNQYFATGAFKTIADVDVFMFALLGVFLLFFFGAKLFGKTGGLKKGVK
ncbi:LexA-binding, inner membrane-associated putative hydrolase [uncultured archaeon]|nr:LexA-binding, inner membrane-associated putative hydrolase [uncultured archaeon]